MAIICRDLKLLFIMVGGTGCTSIGRVLRDRFGGEFLPASDYVGDARTRSREHTSIEELIKYKFISKQELDSYLKFATVRNPFDQFASQYQRLTGKWIQKHLDVNHPKSWAGRLPQNEREEYITNKLIEIERARDEGFEKWLLNKIDFLEPKSPLKSYFRVKIKPLIDREYNESLHKRKMHLLYPLIEGVDEVMRYEKLDDCFNEILYKVGIKDYVKVINVNPTPGKRHYRDYYSSGLRSRFERIFVRELSVFDYSF